MMALPKPVRSSAFLSAIFIFLLAFVVQAVPQKHKHDSRSSTSSYWLANVKRQGSVAFGSDPGYKIFRNVIDYGAKGDGFTDDTEAINAAISDGNRCAEGCDSSTTTPAIVYFPPGTYLVSSPIVALYYTQLIGDAIAPPTIRATGGFQGLAVIDVDPYIPGGYGANFYTNQNNFYRQIRNFVIDLRGLSIAEGAGIHWQVAQASSLQNIVFNMFVGGGSQNMQKGIFMDNGSGGVMSDLIFNGGGVGAFLGNQQFTTRNITFNNCQTAIYMNWNWIWTMKSVNVFNCQIGLDISGLENGVNQSVGSFVLLDSHMSGTTIGVKTSFNVSSEPRTGGTLVVQNVDFTDVQIAIAADDGSDLLPGGSIVDFWIQGNVYQQISQPGKVRRMLSYPTTNTNNCEGIAVQSATTKTNIPFLSSSITFSNVNSMPSATTVTVTVTTTLISCGCSSAISVSTGRASSVFSPFPSTSVFGSSKFTPTSPQNNPNYKYSTWTSPSKLSSLGSSTSTTTSTTSGFQPSLYANTTTTGASSTSSSIVNSSFCESASVAMTKNRTQGKMAAPNLSPSLMMGDRIFERSKPQYESIPVSSIISIKSCGAKGDGVTDDTVAIQNCLNNATLGQLVYFDHGAYLVRDTVTVPNNISITGEIWPIIMADGAAFNDPTNPRPVFRIGNPGDVGVVELSDLVFETLGAAPGAIMMEWNIHELYQGSCAMWDVHFRIGGTAGTHLQQDACIGDTTDSRSFNAECAGSFLMLHITQRASAYFENVWLWVADHEIDMPLHNQTNIYNGRGLLVESQGPTWLYGTSSEHSQLYNYQVMNAQNLFMGTIQTETAYMQPGPNALDGGFKPNATFNDPTFETCTTDQCTKTWGLRILNSTKIYTYGAGLYSFFDDYVQECLTTQSCQENMVEINCSSDIYFFALNTLGATNMVVVNGQSEALQADNTNGYCQTIALFTLTGEM